MINRIKTLLGKERGEQPARGARSHEDKQVAAAALLVEAARMDAQFDPEERLVIAQLLQQRFGLSDKETESLIMEAEDVQGKSNQLIRFTKSIKEQFSEEERIELLEMLWEVAYADGRLHHYEANLLRRVGGLIYVSDRDRGAARKRVLRRMGLDDGRTG